MAYYYLDSSVLVKRYVTEPGSVWVRQLLGAPANYILAGEITIAEVAAAFAILVRTGRLTSKGGRMAYDEFLADIVGETYDLSPVTRQVVVQAAELTQRYPLKGYDAVQIATALQLDQALKTQNLSLIFVSGDQSMLDAAVVEGLEVDNPFDHTHLDRQE